MEKKPCIYIMLLLLFLAGNRLEAMSDTILLKKYDSPMHHLYQIRKAMTDSLYVAAFKETRYFDRDSLFIRYT